MRNKCLALFTALQGVREVGKRVRRIELNQTILETDSFHLPP